MTTTDRALRLAQQLDDSADTVKQHRSWRLGPETIRRAASTIRELAETPPETAARVSEALTEVDAHWTPATGDPEPIGEQALILELASIIRALTDRA